MRDHLIPNGTEGWVDVLDDNDEQAQPAGVEQEDDGSRALHFAAYHGNQQLIDILMNSGADPLLPNNNRLNVLHMAAQGDQPYSLMLFK